MNCNIIQPSLAIGGIGGSGTRAVAQLFQEKGYFMGYDLNGPIDTLLYTLMFKRKEILLLDNLTFKEHLTLFYKIMATEEELSENDYSILYKLAKNDNSQHDTQWLIKRIENHKNIQRKKQILWGWKEPNTHVIIDKILDNTPSLKFIYVYRNGLDMAYSSNQNQLKFWGNIFLNEDSLCITPANSLKYWCEVHRRMIRLQKVYPEQIYMLNLDNICENPQKNLEEMFGFLKISSFGKIEELSSIFKTPISKNRYKEHPLDIFHNDDLAYVQTICP